MAKANGRDNRRFELGSGVYTCRICEKRTRETGDGESDVQLCAFCYGAAGWENTVQDGVCTIDEVPAKFRATVAEWLGIDLSDTEVK